MSELKPCPFCGGRATVKTRYIGYGSIGLGEHDEYRVVCKECRASNAEYRAEAESIAAWNRRADVAPVVRGEWKMDTDPDDGDCRCSNCLVCIDALHRRNHEVLNALGYKLHTFYKYCPNCGAKMDGGTP